MTETQEYLLGLLKEIDDICQKHQIDYYLAGGSLVGAIRHKGFLPWDDDADIHMTRENAEKFAEAVKEENIPGRIVFKEAENGDYGIVHWRYQNTEATTLLRCLVGSTSRQGQFVDIFILYPLPRQEEEARRCLEDYQLYLELRAQNFTVTSKGRDEEYLKRYQKAKRLEKVIGKKRVRRNLEKRMFFYPEEEATHFFIRSPIAPRIDVPKEFWGKPRYVEFETIKLPVPEYAEKFLCHEYSPSWFEVPAHVDREEHTFVSDFTLSSDVYMAEYDKHINAREFYEQEIKKKEYWFRFLGDRNVVNPQIHTMRGQKVALEIQHKVENYGIDLKALVSQGRKEELEILFKPYFEFLSISEIRYWGLYVDMPDDYLFAALYFYCFNGNYGTAKKILNGRRKQERTLSQDLVMLCEICDATDELLTELYGNRDYAAARKVTEEWLGRYPDLLYFMRAKMVLDIQERAKEDAKRLLEQCEKYLEKYEDDGELLKYRGDLLLELGRKQEAEICYQKAKNHLRNGYCITEIKEYFQAKAEE